MVNGKAYAKINLTLDVTGVLENGYHSIASVMQTISLYDEISVEKNQVGEIRLFSDGGKFADGMPLDEKNTCHKAARVFLEHVGITDGVDIHIKKNIPSQAGLGGGSSDAATVLRLLNRLFETNLSYDELRELGIKVGADVPFLVTGGCALCEGMGEILTPIEKNLSGYLLLIKPDFGISTPEAYRLFDEKKLPYGQSAKKVAERLSNGSTINPITSNDLEDAIGSTEIMILEIRLIMHKAKAVMMTGSGSCVYGRYKTKKAAEEAAKAFSDQPFVGVYKPVSSEKVIAS